MKKFYQAGLISKRVKALLLAICMLSSVLMLAPLGTQIKVNAEEETVTALHLQEWKDSGCERTVSVENGKTYTFSLLWRYINGESVSFQLSNNAVGGSYRNLIQNTVPQEGVTLNRNTGRISYTFTSQGDTLGLGCYLNGSGERRAYIADLQMYESDAAGNPIEGGAVIDCESNFDKNGIWKDFYVGFTNLETVSRGFFTETAPTVLTGLDIGYTYAPSFNSKTYSYIVTVPNSVTQLNIQPTLADGATLGGISGNEGFEVGVPKDVVITINDNGGGITTYKLTVTREQEYTTTVKAMHLREWKDIGTERTVSVENGKTYTFSMLWGYLTGESVSFQLSNNAVGSKYTKLIENTTPQADVQLDRSTGRISYTFTSQGDTLGLGCYLNTLVSGHDNWERRVYIADLQMYESDAQGNPIDGGAVIDCQSGYDQSLVWKTFYGYTAEVTVAERSFFASIFPGSLNALDVGYTLTPAFSSRTYDYTVSVPYSVTKLNINTTLADGATLVGISGNENFQVGVQNKVAISISDGSVYTLTVTREPDYVDTMTAMRIHEWNDAGVNNTVTVENGKTYTLNVFWKHIKGGNPLFQVGGSAIGGYKNIITAKTPTDAGAVYSAATGILSYTFTAQNTEFVMSAQMGNAGGEKDFYFAKPTLFESDAQGNKIENGAVIDCDAEFDDSWAHWGYGGNYRSVEQVDLDFFTVYGDANADGTFNIADLVRVKKFAAGTNVYVTMEVIGKDKADTTINAQDLSNVRKWLLNDSITPTKTVHTKSELLNLTGYLTNQTDNYAIGMHTYGALNIESRIKEFAQLTGRKPAYVDFDMNALPFVETSADIEQAVKELTKFAENGGFVTITDHWITPTNNYSEVAAGGANNSRGTLTKEQYKEVMTENTTLNDNFISELKVKAQFLNQLKTNGVPVIYRPMHEANGEWFWWGINTAQGITGADVAELYRYVYNYFTVTNGLDNIIWEFCPSINGGQATLYDWYPGAEYVDILSADWYLPNNSYKDFYDETVAKYGTTMPVSIAEFGGDGDYNMSAYPLTETLAKIEAYLDQGAKVGFVGIYSDMSQISDATLSLRAITLNQMSAYWAKSLS